MKLVITGSEKGYLKKLGVVNEVFLKQSTPHPTQSYKADQPSCRNYKGNRVCDMEPHVKLTLQI